MSTTTCQCECGQTRLTVSGTARLRMLCHCTICQRFNRSTHADVLVFKTSQVKLADPASVDFKTYKPPPHVNRGVCRQCRQPVIELFAMPLMPQLTMVPAPMFADPSALPEPCAHMFYEHRQQDADDDLPKINGFIRSQWAFFRRLWFGR